MGFFKTFKNEFGKKTGKALGNKLYGAYADDKRVGVNRGKLKGESDGVKITSEIRQAEMALEKERTKYNKKQAEYERKQAEYEREQTEYERGQVEYEKNQKLLSDVLNIDLDPTQKNSLIKSLTALSVYVDLWEKESNPDEHLIAAKTKFDTGVAMLQAIDPQNPMVFHFLQKKTELINKKKKKRREMWIFIIILVAFFIGLFIYLHLSGELYKESPLEKLINKYL